VLSAGLYAQVATSTKKTAEDTSEPKKEEIVVISPFKVVSDDRGYQATNTMSGTRLNTKLEDVFASVTVVTKQQMIDTAVLDMNDVFKYEASTEGTANFTLISKDQNGSVSDKTASDPQRANRIRGLSGGLGSSVGANSGGVNTAWGNFQSNGSIPFDLYNVEAVEISRGPNSSLFGIGQPNGTVNVVPTQANPQRFSFAATLRADDWGGNRASVNINQPLITNKLAIRVAAVNEEKGFTRKPASERARAARLTARQHAAPYGVGDNPARSDRADDASAEAAPGSRQPTATRREKRRAPPADHFSVAEHRRREPHRNGPPASAVVSCHRYACGPPPRRRHRHPGVATGHGVGFQTTSLQCRYRHRHY
jgi:outer membrane receptor protein involved in Fe transport